MQPPECKSCGHRHWQIEGCGPAEAVPDLPSARHIKGTTMYETVPQPDRQVYEDLKAYEATQAQQQAAGYMQAAPTPALGDILDVLPVKPLSGLAAVRTADLERGVSDEEWRKGFGTTATEAMEASTRQAKPVIHASELMKSEGAHLLAIRQGLKLSQPKFSAQFGVPVGTLRGWESGRHKMPPYFMTLLRVIELEPKAVFRALGRKE